MSDYSMSVYDLAVSNYEKSDAVGVPLHDRPKAIIEAWVKAAQRQIAAGSVSLSPPARRAERSRR